MMQAHTPLVFTLEDIETYLCPQDLDMLEHLHHKIEQGRRRSGQLPTRFVVHEQPVERQALLPAQHQEPVPSAEDPVAA